MATPITPQLLTALKAVEAEFDGLSSLTIVDALHFNPQGKRQDCTVGEIAEYEYCEQSQGLQEDSFYGVTSWRIGDQYIVATFSS